MQVGSECRLLLKTTPARHAALLDALRAAHPYELPALVTLRPYDVHPPYAHWLLNQTRGSPRRTLWNLWAAVMLAAVASGVGYAAVTVGLAPAHAMSNYGLGTFAVGAVFGFLFAFGVLLPLQAVVDRLRLGWWVMLAWGTTLWLLVVLAVYMLMLGETRFSAFFNALTSLPSGMAAVGVFSACMRAAGPVRYGAADPSAG